MPSAVLPATEAHVVFLLSFAASWGARIESFDFVQCTLSVLTGGVEEESNGHGRELFSQQVVEQELPLGKRGYVPDYVEAAEELSDRYSQQDHGEEDGE